MKAENYTSATVKIPLKLLQTNDVVLNGKIRPLHLQLVLTNKCNAACKNCTCRDIDRSKEASYYELKNIIRFFDKRGVKAITLTGGGEPTLYPQLKNLLDYINKRKIKVGIITNGIRWITKNIDLKLEREILTWVRISYNRKYSIDDLENFCSKFIGPDLGLNFVLNDSSDIEVATNLAEVATNPNIKYLRIVSNLYDLKPDLLNQVQKKCSKITDKLICQYYNKGERGQKECFLPLVKPYIDVDGNVFPCCGVQLARGEKHIMDEKLKMGHWKNFDNLNYFNGSKCTRCYYNGYNKYLKMLLTKIKHREFI